MNIKTKFNVGDRVYFIFHKCGELCKHCGCNPDKLVVKSEIIESISTLTQNQYSGSGGCFGTKTEIIYDLSGEEKRYEHGLFKTEKEAQAEMKRIIETQEAIKQQKIKDAKRCKNFSPKK